MTGERSNAASFSNESLIISRDGATVDVSGDDWVVRGAGAQFYFSFSRLVPFVSPSVIIAAKNVVSIYIRSRSLPHANNLFDRFCAFCRFVGNSDSVDKISVQSILTYRSSLSKEKEWYLGSLRGFFRTWRDSGSQYMDHDVVDVLEGMSLKGNEKGRAVRTASTREGPLTDLEFKGVVDGLHTAFADGWITREDYVLASVFIGLGVRPVQVALLKVGDFTVSEATDGSRSSILRVPRAKMRNTSPRAEFKNKAYPAAYGESIG